MLVREGVLLALQSPRGGKHSPFSPSPAGLWSGCGLSKEWGGDKPGGGGQPVGFGHVPVFKPQLRICEQAGRGPWDSPGGVLLQLRATGLTGVGDLPLRGAPSPLLSPSFLSTCPHRPLQKLH